MGLAYLYSDAIRHRHELLDTSFNCHPVFLQQFGQRAALCGDRICNVHYSLAALLHFGRNRVAHVGKPFARSPGLSLLFWVRYRRGRFRPCWGKLPSALQTFEDGILKIHRSCHFFCTLSRLLICEATIGKAAIFSRVANLWLTKGAGAFMQATHSCIAFVVWQSLYEVFSRTSGTRLSTKSLLLASPRLQYVDYNGLNHPANSLTNSVPDWVTACHI